MVSYDENIDRVASPQEVVTTIRDAHEFFLQNKVDERYQLLAFDIIRRYVSKDGIPRDVDPFFGAALYIVTRHPWSHPNPLTKTEFAGRLRMKESSLDWYTDSVMDKLDFIALHDKNQFPFYFDPKGTIASVMDSIVRSSVAEEVVRGIIKGTPTALPILAEKIVDRLCSVVKIIPSVFEQELFNLIQRKIEDESTKLRAELGNR